MINLSHPISSNLEVVLGKIEKAALRSGRKAQDIKLVVVSKAQPINLIRAAYECGIRRFGENYPQEAENKIAELVELPGIEWHMIGHLQSRKVSIIADHFHYIHSIDRMSLAEKLNRAVADQGKILPSFLEVNVSGELSKSGWFAGVPEAWPKILDDFSAIAESPNLRILGLMTMPPYFDDPEKARPFFSLLRNLRDYLSSNIPKVRWNELSMGTSGDFEVAIEEGATFVRIGQAILGPRPAR